MGSETKAPDKTSEDGWTYWVPDFRGDSPPGVSIETHAIEFDWVLEQSIWEPIVSGEVTWFPDFAYRYRPKAAPPVSLKETTSALDVQISGDHYKNRKIQPVEFIHANNLPFIEGCVVKYVTRWREKGGVPDLLKAKHYIELLIELGRLPVRLDRLVVALLQPIDLAERVPELRLVRRLLYRLEQCLHELRNRKKNIGLISICAAGGLGSVMVVEAID